MQQNRPNPAAMRKAAEELLKKDRTFAKPIETSDHARLVHELQVHQIELELQNEDLSKAYEEVAVLRDKYVELFDFAPIAYFTLAGDGRIVELNLGAATLLGENRLSLVGRGLQEFVSPDSMAAFTKFLEAASAAEESSASLTMRRGADGVVYVRAQGRSFESLTGVQIRIVLIDMTELRSLNEELRRSFEKFFTYWRP